MKIFTSKYALTVGIEELEAEKEVSLDENVSVVRPNGFLKSYYRKGDWHLTRDDAVKKAEIMRQNRLKSLAKQIKKLEGLAF